MTKGSPSNSVENTINVKLNKTLLRRGFITDASCTKTSEDKSTSSNNLIDDGILFDLHSSALASPISSADHRNPTMRSYVNPNVGQSNDSWKNKYLQLKTRFQKRLEKNKELSGTINLISEMDVSPKQQ